MSGISTILRTVTLIDSTNGTSTADIVSVAFAAPRNVSGNIQRYLMAFVTSGTAPTARLEGSHSSAGPWQTISTTITASSSPTTAGATLVTVACPYVRGRLIAPATDTVGATLILC